MKNSVRNFVAIFASISTMQLVICNENNQDEQHALHVQIKPELNKPAFYQTNFYAGGKYTQFTVDSRAFYAGLAAGGCARLLFSFANCGNKYETFKSSVLRPGIAKSALFWVPTFLMYNYTLSLKEKAALQKRLDDDHSQSSKQSFSEFSACAPVRVQKWLAAREISDAKQKNQSLDQK